MRKSKRHNSEENYPTDTKLELAMHILMKHQYTEFQFKMSIYDTVNEWKLSYWNFSKFNGHNPVENNSTATKYELDLHILRKHLYTDYQITRCPWRTFQAGGIKIMYDGDNDRVET